MQIEVFKNAGFEIRGGLIDGEPYFVANDISSLLGYANTHAMIERLDDDEKSSLKDLLKSRTVQNQDLPKISGVRYDAILLTESGLYSSILWSQKPEAKQFKKWVTSEVLPSIRKHGVYVKAELLADTDLLIDTLNQLRDEKNKAIQEKAYIGSKREATAMATASREKRKAQKLEILLDESLEWATVKKIQIATGKKYKWSKLVKVSKEMNIPPRKVHDINYGEVNSYHNLVWMKCYDIDLKEVA